MKNLQSFVAASVLATAASVTAAQAEDTVKIGFVMSYSGWFQQIDAATIKGAELAVAEINENGGILGRQIEILPFDNKSEPPLGADGALEVIGNGATAVMLPSDFDFGAPGAFVAQQNGVIALSGASDPKFGVTGIGPYAYSISNAAQSQGALLAEWALNEQGWDTAYVLLDNTISYTNSLCDSFAKRWKEIAPEGSLLGEDRFRNDDASIASQVTRIKGLEAQPEAIMMCSYAPGGPSAIRQLRAAGVTSPVLTGESLDGDYWIGIVPDLSDFYVVNYGSVYGDDPSEAVNGFFTRYEAATGGRADVSYALRGYSMIEAYATAANRAGSLDADAVSAELNKFDEEPLVIGNTTFNEDLHIATTRPMLVMQAQDGKFSAVGRFAASVGNLD
ncbi:ABC transporter substrate-binding protein [Shimia sediminis]|uniref:ABC transporter substrate-binding protein n=1 Tax=Shimia sediminis TaxID=2497945 RepID=UPI0013DE9743|nr:ABC transporter substrate-binding protein [Shimia sediminis]